MSRNDGRLGLNENNSHTSEAPAPVATTGTGDSPSFSWSVPSEFVELPSQGKLYPADHPLYNQSTVEIRYMTAKEEDILTSRSLLKEGVALNRMLYNKNIDVSTLLVGDKNALLVAARRTGYGPDYDTKVTCPVCSTTQDHSFDISEPTCKDYAQVAEEFSVEITPQGLLRIPLPMTSATVECRFLTSADEENLLKETERKQKRKIESAVATDAFRSYIVSVNGQSDRLTIESFIQAMPARDARVLRKVYSSVVPNIDLTQNFECSECGYTTDMEVPLGVDFFWPQ
jgi:rubredoxin